MKEILFLVLLLWGISFCAKAADQPFVFEDPAGNLTNDSPSERDVAIFNDLWMGYLNSLAFLNKKIVVTPEYRDNEKAVKSILINKYAVVLQAMLELRAFTAQHKTIEIPSDRAITIGKIDAILKGLNLYYEPRKHLYAFVDQLGVDRIREVLLPLAGS